MRVIFLDFNGVLDTYENMNIVDIENLNILMDIIKETDAKIVISSSIKNTYFYNKGEHGYSMKYLLSVLEKYNIEIYGITPLCSKREDEIKSYLKEHSEITSYCIIDDDYYFVSMEEHMIKLKSQYDGGNGLKEYDKDKIIKVLKKGFK